MGGAVGGAENTTGEIGHRSIVIIKEHLAVHFRAKEGGGYGVSPETKRIARADPARFNLNVVFCCQHWSGPLLSAAIGRLRWRRAPKLLDRSHGHFPSTFESQCVLERLVMVSAPLHVGCLTLGLWLVKSVTFRVLKGPQNTTGGVIGPRACTRPTCGSRRRGMGFSGDGSFFLRTLPFYLFSSGDSS